MTRHHKATATQRVLITLHDYVSMQERVKAGQGAVQRGGQGHAGSSIEAELLNEATAALSKAKARVDAAVESEKRAKAKAEEAVVRMRTAVEVAESAERDMRREAFLLLRERLECAYRRGRLAGLLKEGRAMQAVLQASMARREERRAFRELLPVSSGFEDLDDFVRQCVT